MTTPPLVKNVPLGDMLSVRARLMSLGWASLAQWAKAYNHKPVTAAAAIRTWGHRSDRTPHGGLSRAVVHDLRTTMDKGIRPNDAKQTA